MVMSMSHRARLRQVQLEPEIDYGSFLLSACGKDRKATARLRDAMRSGLKTRRAIMLASRVFRVEPSFWFLTRNGDIEDAARLPECKEVA